MQFLFIGREDADCVRKDFGVEAIKMTLPTGKYLAGIE